MAVVKGAVFVSFGNKTRKKEMESQQLAHLLALEWDASKVLEWLREDIPSFDYGGFVVG